MLIVQDQKKILLKLKNPQKVTDIIPSAQELQAGVVSVNHCIDEVQVLRNVGIEAPSPILYYYKWRGRYTPYDHQRQTSAFLTMHKKCLVLNEIGTGKTQSALWAADFLMEQGLVKKVLIVSPLSTLDRVWADGLFTSFSNRTYAVLHGSAERRRKLLATECDFYIINHDGFAIVADQCQGKFDLIIVDEAAVLRNPSTMRFKTVWKYMRQNPDTRLWLMTGTPTPNEPTDAWALAKLVDSPALSQTTYTGFRDKVMMKVGQWRWTPRPSSPEVVSKILHPSVRYTREECLELPDTVFQTRETTLTPEQRKFYKEMVKHLVTEMNGGQITAANEAVKMQKLIQIACGVAYDSASNPVEVDASPRVSLLKDIIEEAGSKVMVFVPLTGVLHMLEREMSKHFSVSVVYGDVSAPKRSEIFRAFQQDKEPQVLIAHPATMAHGLTLTASSTIVWYSSITSNEIYQQANGRIERIGKNKSSTVIHIEATDLERRIFDRLRNKQKLQGVLLDILGEG